MESIGKSAEPAYPPVAATAFFLVGQTGWWFQEDPAETVAAWSRVAYWECVSELGDAEAAAWSTAWLARALAEIGDDAAARAVYQVVSDVNRSAPAELARACRETGAVQAWGQPRDGATSPEGSRDTYAVVRYALWLDSDGLWLDDDDRAEQVRALLLKAAAGTGRGASRATLELGLLAEDADDEDQARDWWLRTVELGDPALAMEATRHLGWLAKSNDDVPETLRWFGSLADADHPDAPWAAAQLGDLYYWRDDRHKALGWYRRALDGADDPEVVGEAALRAGEILSDQGETRAARTMLMRGIASGDTIFVGQARELLTRLGAVADD